MGLRGRVEWVGMGFPPDTLPATPAPRPFPPEASRKAQAVICHKGLISVMWAVAKPRPFRKMPRMAPYAEGLIGTWAARKLKPPPHMTLRYRRTVSESRNASNSRRIDSLLLSSATSAGAFIHSFIRCVFRSVFSARAARTAIPL